VASHAAKGFPVSARNDHALLELIPMRIAMAACAGQVVEVVGSIRFRGRLQISCVFVTVRARGGDVSACEHEARVFVARQRERRGMEALNVVAVFAAIQVRRGGELILMLVTMAI
jgi:hypothetical protein